MIETARNFDVVHREPLDSAETRVSVEVASDPSDERTSPTPPTYNEQFGRVKGAKWFEKAYYKNVAIIGQGGIGSWLSLLMSRLGSQLHTFDMDTFEVHNMTGQLVRNSDVGKRKTDAIYDIVRIFNTHSNVYTNDAYNSDSYVINITMCALDNMATRRLAFERWRNYISTFKDTDPDFPKTCFFQDGRLKADQLQIFNIPGDREDLMDTYESEYLFEDSAVDDGDCTFKQTSHCAAMIAGHMVAFYTNWLTNWLTNDPEYTKLPFYYEYVIPFNMTMIK